MISENPASGADNLHSKDRIAFDISSSSFRQIQSFIGLLVFQGTFSIGSIKRKIHAYLRERRGGTGRVAMHKPSGLEVEEMFDRAVMRPGSRPLPIGTHGLRVAEFAKQHCLVCTACGSGSVSEGCYFSSMLACIERGWAPPIRAQEVRPRYHVEGNYDSVSLFSYSVGKEILDMVAHKVIVPCLGLTPGVTSPFQAVIKNSDKVRARVLVGVEVVDQQSLSRASTALVDAGHNKIKVRVAYDMSATGVNAAVDTPPFSYPQVSDALRILTPGCWMAKGDVSRYFHSFPLALDVRHMFRCMLTGIDDAGSPELKQLLLQKLWQYAVAPFGFSLCPYYCSTWSAEFRRWVKARQIPSAHMVDDWFTVGRTEAQARERMLVITELLESCGFSLATEKFEFGTQMVFLGVLIDSCKMVLRFESTQSKGMRLQLETYLKRIANGADLDHSTIRHVCGKLNWFSEIVQSGRMHTRSWWAYERYGNKIYTNTKNKLISDTQWWIDLLRSWELGHSSGVEYPILSASTLLTNNKAMYILHSDASGTDGFGYFGAYLVESELTFTSKRWQGDPPNASSHAIELMALEDFLGETEIQHCILVWITDNEGAEWSVNKGRCKDERGVTVLRNILYLCDMKRIQIVALWIPRELNELADYLSHLSYILDRDEVRGDVSDLERGLVTS